MGRSAAGLYFVIANRCAKYRGIASAVLPVFMAQTAQVIET
jgi:hypothetical protein